MTDRNRGQCYGKRVSRTVGRRELRLSGFVYTSPNDRSLTTVVGTTTC